MIYACNVVFQIVPNGDSRELHEGDERANNPKSSPLRETEAFDPLPLHATSVSGQGILVQTSSPL